MAVLVDNTWNPANTYAVYLIGLDGRIVASTTATKPTSISTWPAASPIASLWSTYATTSNTGVYFRSGDTEVKLLTPNGNIRTVAHLEGGPSSRSFFAVSADDKQIAVSVLDYSSPPTVRMRFYTQDLSGGPQQAVYRPSANTFFWPIGWHDRRIVAQVGAPIPGTLYGAYPEAATNLLLIDPATSTAVTIGGPDCRPQPSLATPAGIVCADSTGANFKVVGWDGRETSFSGHVGTGGLSLSTDGRSVATSDQNGILIYSSIGSSVRAQTPNIGFPGESGWIDSTHFFYRVADTTRQAIYDVNARSTTVLNLDGHLVARLPGGL